MIYSLRVLCVLCVMGMVSSGLWPYPGRRRNRVAFSRHLSRSVILAVLFTGAVACPGPVEMNVCVACFTCEKCVCRTHRTRVMVTVTALGVFILATRQHLLKDNKRTIPNPLSPSIPAYADVQHDFWSKSSVTQLQRESSLLIAHDDILLCDMISAGPVPKIEWRK
jgi:hypothetical protein